MHDTIDNAVVINPKTSANATVIWLHGLGADGHDFEPIVDELNFPAKNTTRFIFPHAPQRPVTINNGYVMPAWYDIVAIDRSAPQDAKGIKQSTQRVYSLIAHQQQQGVQANRIVLAGFSQGGAVILYAGLRYEKTLAGLMALSTYLPLSASLAAELNIANQRTPIYMAHGTADTVVPIALAQHSKEVLTQNGCQVEWHTYAMPHGVVEPEIKDIDAWLGRVLPVT